MQSLLACTRKSGVYSALMLEEQQQLYNSLPPQLHLRTFSLGTCLPSSMVACGVKSAVYWTAALPHKTLPLHMPAYKLAHMPQCTMVDCRRAKNVLLTDAIDSLNKKVKKGKGVTKQLQQDRLQQVRSSLSWSGALSWDGDDNAGSCILSHSAAHTKRLGLPCDLVTPLMPPWVCTSTQSHASSGSVSSHSVHPPYQLGMAGITYIYLRQFIVQDG